MIETIRPLNIEELRAAVAGAAERALPLEILGRGSKRDLGRPVEAQAVIDLSRLAGIRLYEPEELVLKAGAGTSMAEIEAVIAQRGQVLAFEPPDLAPLYGGAAGSGSIGGTIACNLAGPRRLKAGAARDHFLGFAAVSGRGEIFKAGGRVVKNVTGYDLPKLLAGSHGTLAVMTEVTLRVHPAPETVRTLILVGLDDARAVEAMAVALGSPHEISGAAHLPPGEAGLSAVDRIAETGTGVTALRVEGPPASVSYRIGALEAWLRRFGVPSLTLDPAESAILWREIRDVRSFAAARLDPRMPLWRLSVPPSEGPRIVAAIQAARPGARHLYDWGGGLVWLALPHAPDAHAGLVRGALQTQAGSQAGHATLIRAEASVRRAVPVFEPEAPALAALGRRVKAAFDPLSILNRGRMG
ncbi:MAG TPA: FAD-binding protein [Hypericibacter adhaerens]|jgi:glycolate oxidase FAD binding subunit|uniref:FAD-binding protein n=1 Tax=Hypericibacter adhaerens TaxID=2602016 RepID=UPI002C9A3B4C|nr:FAD-binding protein [Hypericibacter adhaerens]HWA42800.1 FAD-binding protein [Hypericibacter adhaerens]